MKSAAESLVSMDARYNPRSLEHRGLDTEAFKRSFLEGLVYTVGKDTRAATRRDWFTTSAFGVRDRLVDRWMETTRNYYKADAKRVYYLSLEFLIGRLMTNSLANLGVMQAVGDALRRAGLRLDDIVGHGAGRGAGQRRPGPSGRLLPGQHGDAGPARLRLRHPLRVRHVPAALRARLAGRAAGPLAASSATRGSSRGPEILFPVQFYGRVEETRDSMGERAYKWVDTERVLAMAYDTPVVGYGGKTINTLRLWSAKATSDFDFGHFNDGDYMKAVEHKILSENLSACSTRTTRPTPAASCASSRSTSSSARRCRTSCAATASITAASTCCRTRSRSSSTTRIPPSASPS